MALFDSFILSLAWKSGEVPNDNDGALAEKEGGSLKISFCCAAGSFVVDKMDLSVLPWKKLAAGRVPNGAGFPGSRVPGLAMDDKSVG